MAPLDAIRFGKAPDGALRDGAGTVLPSWHSLACI